MFQVDTRWNTLLYMLDSILKNYDFIKKVQEEREYFTLDRLYHEERNILRDLVTVLQPFEEITKNASGI